LATSITSAGAVSICVSNSSVATSATSSRMAITSTGEASSSTTAAVISETPVGTSSGAS
jgi:hypothetical protein